MKDKILKISAPLSIKEADDGDESLTITGMASTNEEDRSGDIIVSDAWTKSGALDNYLKNPVVLAFHDMTRPIGKTIGHETTGNGLKITAKISKTASDIIGLIKEGILSAFSVGFMIKDADYDRKTGGFIIKEVELLEVSVVSIPANQGALFSLEKNFSTESEYKEFKKQFIKSEQSEETLMDDKDKKLDLKAMMAELKADLKKDLEDEAKAKKTAEEAKKAEEARVEAAATTAAERLIKDFEDKLKKTEDEKDSALAETLSEFSKFVKEMKEGDLSDAFKAKDKKESKMKYTKGESLEAVDKDLRDGILFASKFLQIPATDTKAFKNLVTKSNMEHWDSGVTGEWEEEYSTRVYNAMRQKLVVETLFSTLPMNTPTLNIPINPEAGNASWIHPNAYRSSLNPSAETGTGTTVSTGAAVDHEIDENVLISYKLATREYIGYEEEEDSIVALAPIIRDAVARRMAKSSDLAFLRGAGSLTTTTYDPITGLVNLGSGTTDVEISGGAAWKTTAQTGTTLEDKLVDMRRNLGLYGLEQGELRYVVSHDLYYEMLKLDNFKTIDVMGDKATLVTGQVGAFAGTPVIVSQQFDNSAVTAGTPGTVLGVLVRPDNFITGIHRGLMSEADKDIVNQKRVLVSSRRFAFRDIIAGQATINLSISS